MSAEKSASSALHKQLAVGEVASRSGLTVSAIRFYEAKGLIGSWRSPAVNPPRHCRFMIGRFSYAET